MSTAIGIYVLGTFIGFTVGLWVACSVVTRRIVDAYGQTEGASICDTIFGRD